MGCTWKDFRNYWVNDGLKAVAITLYVIANGFLFGYYFYDYFWGSNQRYYNVIGIGVPLARGAAAPIRLNCAFILITVLRNFLSWVRGTWVGTYIPIDKNIVFHKGIAWTIAAFATVHTAAHFYNFYQLAVVDIDSLKQVGLLESTATSNLPISYYAFQTVPGVTGHLVCLIMAFMYTSAVDGVRRPMFEAFWFTHHLFIAFYGLLCFHGAAALFGPPQFWMWFIGPGLLYLIERTIRIIRGSQSTIILQCIQHPSKVLELRMKKTTFNYKPGQYVFLQCPYIARFEWHPFTISSAPQEDFLSVHIRVVGDWTGKLHRLLNPENKPSGIVQENMLTAPNGRPIILVDGPFGAASEDVFKFENVMLFAAGIGVTPFASILKTIRYKVEAGEIPLKYVAFYWISRDATAFEWFIDLLADLEQRCKGFLEINLYFTGALNADQVRSVMFHSQERTDSLTGLESRTNFGRPNIQQIFKEKAEKFVGQRVGVFFCGPPLLSKKLYSACRKNTKVKGGARFVYHKENF